MADNKQLIERLRDECDRYRKKYHECRAELVRYEAENERLRAVYGAAKGLCAGQDWNNGTHAKLHGYKQKLRDAVAAVQEGDDDPQKQEGN